jgi:hypothetical protein
VANRDGHDTAAKAGSFLAKAARLKACPDTNLALERIMQT